MSPVPPVAPPANAAPAALWLPATEAAAWFAQQSPPIKLDRTTVARQAKKHDADGGTIWRKIGRANHINVTALLPLYCEDYGRALHAGELSAPTLPQFPPAQVKPARAPRQIAPSAPDAADNDATHGDKFANDPLKRKAHEQARKAARENAEAEGQLVPAASLHAAAASAIAETVAAIRRENHRTAEEIGAKAKRPELVGEIRAILETGQAAAFNALSDVFARELGAESGEARDRFKRLEQIAHDMRGEVAEVAA